MPWAPLLLPLLSSAQSHVLCLSQLGYSQILPPSLPALLYAPAIPSCLCFGPGSPLPYPASSSAPKPRCTRGSSQQLPERVMSCKSHPHTVPGPATGFSPLCPSPCASRASSSSQQTKGMGKPASSIPWHRDSSQASAFPADPFGALLDIQMDAGTVLILVFY